MAKRLKPGPKPAFGRDVETKKTAVTLPIELYYRIRNESGPGWKYPTTSALMAAAIEAFLLEERHESAKHPTDSPTESEKTA